MTIITGLSILMRNDLMAPQAQKTSELVLQWLSYSVGAALTLCFFYKLSDYNQNQ